MRLCMGLRLLPLACCCCCFGSNTPFRSCRPSDARGDNRHCCYCHCCRHHDRRWNVPSLLPRQATCYYYCYDPPPTTTILARRERAAGGDRSRHPPNDRDRRHCHFRRPTKDFVAALACLYYHRPLPLRCSPPPPPRSPCGQLPWNDPFCFVVVVVAAILDNSRLCFPWNHPPPPPPAIILVVVVGAVAGAVIVAAALE